MQVRYVTQTGTGTSAWQMLNTHISPMNVGLAMLFSGAAGTASVQYTMEDPFGLYPNPTTSTVTAFTLVAASPSNVTGSLTFPAAALRLNVSGATSTTVVTLAIVEAGIAG